MSEALALLGRAVRRARGEYREDEWGFDLEFAESVLPAFEFLFERWWRVEVEGVGNLPGQGRAMIVANHSGTVFPFDAIMIGTAIQKCHPHPRWPRALVLDWVFELPFLSYLMRRLGAVPAEPLDRPGQLFAAKGLAGPQRHAVPREFRDRLRGGDEHPDEDLED
ncbi:MAG: lysophospholipid acyltransferase family protein, partial [Solirubrobacterales bacterium]